jgi:hypothetical protein
MYLKNPMIRRSIDIQGYYVWGQGVNIAAKHPVAQEVIDDFMEDPVNASEMFSIEGGVSKEMELGLDGNLFFVLFTNLVTGEVKMRTINVDEVTDIITNPQDRKDERFFKRTYTPDGSSKPVTEWYPAIDYLPIAKEASIEGFPVNWDEPVLHMKEGGLHTMRFGVPYIYCALDWATAYKSFLEDWATIMKAYSRLAMQVSGNKGKDKVGAAKSKYGTGLSLNTTDNNPPTSAASWLFSASGVDVKAIKTAGATTSAEEGRPLKLMIAAGVGLPDTFYGDANVGNFATSKTLDRPTELKFMVRQKMWASVITRILAHVLQMSAKAPGGKLKKAGVGYLEIPDGFTKCLKRVMEYPEDIAKACQGRTSKLIQVTFPSILERNVTDRVRAVVNATTLFGKPLAELFKHKRLVVRWLLEALNEPDASRLAYELYPEGEDDTIPPPPAPAAGGPEDPSQGGDMGANG